MAAAVLIKIPATIVLIAFAIDALIYWYLMPDSVRDLNTTGSGRTEGALIGTPGEEVPLRGDRFTWHRETSSPRQAILLAVLLIPLFMWAFTHFDISRPNEHAPGRMSPRSIPSIGISRPMS